MAHFAELDENNTVLRVIVLTNESIIGENGTEDESVGQAFIADTLKLGGVWKQTSYNGKFRGVYAGIGYTYDAVNDVFVAPVVEVPNEVE